MPIHTRHHIRHLLLLSIRPVPVTLPGCLLQLHPSLVGLHLLSLSPNLGWSHTLKLLLYLLDLSVEWGLLDGIDLLNSVLIFNEASGNLLHEV